jgi:hypothetical protein
MPHELNSQPNPQAETPPPAAPPQADGPRYAPEPGFEPRTFVDLDPRTQDILILQDREVAYRLQDQGVFNDYSDEFAAVLYGQLVGRGKDEDELRERVAREYNVHPNRPWLMYFERSDISLIL